MVSNNNVNNNPNSSNNSNSNNIITIVPHCAGCQCDSQKKEFPYSWDRQNSWKTNNSQNTTAIAENESTCFKCRKVDSKLFMNKFEDGTFSCKLELSCKERYQERISLYQTSNYPKKQI